jgi:hypothetical protein
MIYLSIWLVYSKLKKCSDEKISIMTQVQHQTSTLSEEKFWTYLFVAFFGIYVLAQYFLFRNITGHFPNGFETENFYSPIAVHIADQGLQGFINYLGGEMPPAMPYGPTFRPPLYPLVLATLYLATESSEYNALILNNAFLSASIFFTFLTGRFVSARTGALAALLLSLDIILVSEANSTHSDTLFLLLIVCSNYFLVRFLAGSGSMWLLASSAIFLAFAILARNIGLYFAPAMLIVLFYFEDRPFSIRRSMTAILIFSSIVGVAIGGWKWRNLEVSGNAAFASGNMAVHLNHYYLPLVFAKRDGISFDTARQNVKDEFEALPGFQALSEDERQTAKVRYAVATSLKNAHWVTLTLFDNLPKLLLSYPFEVLATVGNKDQVERWKQFDETEFRKRYERSNFDLTAKLGVLKYYWDNGMALSAVYGILNKAVNGTSFILALAGVVLLWRSEHLFLRSLGWLLFLQCFAILAISVLAPSARFRVPIMPYISICAAYAATRIIDVAMSNRKQETTVP